MRKLTVAALAAAFLLSFYPPAQATTATYYSNSFNGRKMANGQRFSQRKMVAAHPSLPLGTRLRLTHRRRSVVVVVADRCRCTLDLSKAAFRQLAPLSKGRIPVKVRRLN